ncbi:uncharacterized protein Dvir_GJ13741 [Drosophila virilis]|uniref:Uncharacterized protein n=2 Tax=Drosophila virilis TaxID=7244 RepID=B4LFX3_DROVI|nr:uncharacterized protein Dvir_GJ13741 [Drosophila virilis]
MPPTGAAASTSGGDPHLQYYTSNRELSVGKRSVEATPPHPCWQYKTVHVGASSQPTGAAPVPRHHSSTLYNAPYWPPQDEKQQQQQQQSQSQSHLVHSQQQPRLGYGKSHGTSAISSSGSGNGSQRYYEDSGKYSATVAGAKLVSYAPEPAARYEPMDHVVNPSNALLGTTDQQPSPNYARKCPQHYEPPIEQRSAAAPSTINHHLTPAQPAQPSQQQQQQLQQQQQQQQQPQQHQSLYMPPNFQNTVHNAIEKYVRETAPAPNLDYRRTSASFPRPTVNYYAATGGSGSASSSSSVASAKLEPEPPALTRASLYHNPYSNPASRLDQEQSSAVVVAVSSRDPSPALAHAYPTKYGKLLPQQQHGTPTATAPPPPPPPPLPLAADVQRRSSFSSTPSYASYYHHGTPSPAAAQVASPTPGQQLYNHTPPPTSGTTTASNYSTLQVYPHGPDICCQPPTPSMATKSTLPSAAKKSAANVKPNYRALINDMLKRNTASEQELNLQIIKKTLKMETAESRLAATTARHSPVTITVPPLPAPVIQQVPLPQVQPQSQPMPLPLPLPNPPAAHSPLDLSMRTIKQTADSTDYKYQRTLTESTATGTPQVSGTGLGLPRFDITPNFARSNRTAPGTPAAATAVIRQAPASTAAAAAAAAAVTASPEATPMLIKAAQQLRPSVLETNPFAKRPQLPPETSIRPLPTPSTTEPGTSTTGTASGHNSSNPNYLGRKRHLQEYNQATAAAAAAAAAATAAAAAKQTRLEAPPATGLVAASVPVIAVNEQATVVKRLEQTSGSRIIVCPQPKQEPMLVPKTEPRIRTKAELKGFTFTPPVLALASSTTTTTAVAPTGAAESTAAPAAALPSAPHPSQQTNHIQIKLEPAPTPELELEDASVTSFNSNSLLDWGSTCNNLVEQLLTKVMPVKTNSVQSATSANESVASAILPTSRIKLELSEDDLPVARILKRQPLPADAESAATTTTQVTNTTTTNGNVFGGAQKKLSKSDREKKRLMQEQRIAARLAPTAGQSSSSESDTTELHRRKTARQKKPLMRKGKPRRSDEKEKQLQQREQQSSDEEQEQDGANSSSEAKSCIKNLVKKTRIAKAKENKVQYTSGKCKRKMSEKQREKEQEQEPELEQDEKSSSSKASNSDEEQQQQQEEQDDEEEDEEDDDDEEEDAREGNQAKRKPKTSLKTRIAPNTMTRSKRKKELELQLANSKVLRNEKIIRNSTTKIKRKYVRKLVPDAKKEMMITRLRNKRESVVDLAQLNGRKLKGNAKTNTTNNNSNSKANPSPQQQLFLEEYRYKLALKIPQRLISINKLNKLPHVAASLPDLERGRHLTQEMSCFKSTRGRKPRSKLQQQQSQQQQQQQQKATPKSIIDVLHLRVTSNGSQQGSKNGTSQLSNCATSLQNYSEASQTSASNSLYEQLQETTEHSLEDSTGKRHFSIFDTKVLQSKTRTESKLQQRREIIREIFVGTERPASAPPECAQQQAAGEGEGSTLSYQQYEDFLEQMNCIVSADNNKLARHRLNDEAKKKTDSPGIATTAAHCPHKRKYLRRKGSSGFDYIRKKKRPTHHHNTSASTTITSTPNATAGEQTTPSLGASLAAMDAAESAAAADERLDDTDSTIAGSSSHLPIKIKTEMDVYREIQKWVLNKGVGQSTMHKAARQGLIDVVVYCLDRMGMNPDLKDNAGYTPLHEACTQGWLEIARILLQFGANHSEAAQSGIRPLHGAIENDHEEVVRLLLSYGADPLLATYSGQTPLMLASSKLMCGILSSHLSDAQSAAADIKPMRFPGPWQIFDKKENGFDIFDNVPNTACDMSRAQTRGRRRQERGPDDNENPAKPKTHSTNNNNHNNHNNNNNNMNGLSREGGEESKETVKQNGEMSAKTATKPMTTTITTTTGTTSATTIGTTTKTETTTTTVKMEPGAGFEDTNNNKNNNDINVEQNVTSVVNGKNEVKREPQDEDDNLNMNTNMNINVNVKHNELNEHNDHIDNIDNDNDNGNDDDEDEETLADELNGDIFKFEEADVPLPPLYLLKDEGSDKWVLLNDLCNLLKVKSKDTLLNKICPNGQALASTQKQLLREFKIDDFLEQATCLQLLCAGEKLNMFSSSKVVLIRYNDSVKNLLGVKTILMKF